MTKYAKYVDSQQPQLGVSSPARPTGLVEGNRFDTSVAVEILACRFFYHLPYYRQQDMFASCGWTPSRSTLLNIVTASEFVLQPLAQYYRNLFQEIDLLACDETPVTLIVPPTLPELDPRDPRTPRIIEVLSAAQEKGRPSVKARMWAYRSLELPFNVFDFTVSRHRDGPDEVLSDFTGSLLGDCWSGFQKIELRSDARIQRGACWAHPRRKLYECRENHPRGRVAVVHHGRPVPDRQQRDGTPDEADRDGEEELAAHWQTGGGSSGCELDDDHQHGSPQRPGRVELSQGRAGPNLGRLHGLGVVASRPLESPASRSRA
jgi:hypothetical protein